MIYRVELKNHPALEIHADNKKTSERSWMITSRTNPTSRL